MSSGSEISEAPWEEQENLYGDLGLTWRKRNEDPFDVQCYWRYSDGLCLSLIGFHWQERKQSIGKGRRGQRGKFTMSINELGLATDARYQD